MSGITIGELIKALQESAKTSSAGMDTQVVLGAGFDEKDMLETLSIQTEPPDGENDLIFEEDFVGQQPYNVGTIARLKNALSIIKEINARRPHDALGYEINDLIDGIFHGNCEKCCEGGDPSCPYYGEPDGCNDRKWQSEHYPTTETYDYVKEARMANEVERMQNDHDYMEEVKNINDQQEAKKCTK